MNRKNAVLLFAMFVAVLPLTSFMGVGVSAPISVGTDITCTVVTELFSLSPRDGQTVDTTGYSTAGIGGGTYRYSLGSVATVDGGFVLPGVGGTLTWSGVTFTGTNGTGRWLAVDQSRIDVKQLGATGDGATDDGPAIRRCLATGKVVEFSRGTYVVAADPASAFDDGGTTRYSYAIAVPSNAVLQFADGATLKLADNSASWTRVVAIQGVSNVRITGELRIDGNVENINAANNEHMHGLFIFDASDVYIQRVDSRNARADNILIAGTDNSTFSKNITIDSIRCVKAGRKNVVFQHFDEVTIGSMDLDNTTGGAAIFSGTADDTDKHCVDVEPDTPSGSALRRLSISTLVTRGSGNDFTAGTTVAHGKSTIINIGSLTHYHSQATYLIGMTSTDVQAWFQNACTIKIGKASFHNVTNAGVNPFQIFYGALFDAESITISGATPAVGDPMILIAQVGGDRPTVRIGYLSLTNTVGAGIENRDASVHVGRYEARTAGTTLWARGLSSTAGLTTDMSVGEFDMEDVGAPAGAGYAVYVSKDGSNDVVVNVESLTYRDTRTPKLTQVFYIGSGAASRLRIGEVTNDTGVSNITWAGADKFVKVAGGGGFPAIYICTGTPEAMITAPIGSVAYRTDGGSATTEYVKEANSDNTGWDPR